MPSILLLLFDFDVDVYYIVYKDVYNVYHNVYKEVYSEDECRAGR